MPTDGQALSLGALFHDLRGGLADRGSSRVLIEFRMESITSEPGGTGGPDFTARRGFRAELDHLDEVLQRAHLVSTAMSPRPLADIVIGLQEDRYLYSLDGASFGPLSDTPRLFDLYAFESGLRRVAVRHATEEADPQPDGSAGRILRISLEAPAMSSLIRLFGDDPAAMSETLDMTGCSVMMTAATAVGIHYRWKTDGEEVVDDSGSAPRRYLTRHRSRMTVQVSPRPAPARPVVGGLRLPLLGGVDDVWSAIRDARTRSAEPAAAHP